MDTILKGLLKGLSLILNLDRELLDIIVLSLKVSGGAVLIGTLLGGGVGIIVGLKEFFGRRFLVSVLNTFMGLPPVVVGLVVYLLLSRSGPLGFMGLLYSPTAMIIAQTILATPIIAALTVSALTGINPAIRDTAISLGASKWRAVWVIVREARFAFMAAVIAGLGRVIAEVGAVLMVGGNIAGYTRVMTTAIALDTSKGEFELAIALGLVLMAISFLINFALNLVQGK